jgi:murein DD-endopeptidase MepM/ murein hydrolase activator NlpD
MKFIFFFSILFITNTAITQPKVEFNAQKTSTGFIIYANNDEYCDVSVKIKFNLKNLSSSNGDEFVTIVPQRIKKFIITELYQENAFAGIGYSYDVVSTMGNVTIESYDSTFTYSLPFEKGNEFKVQQGYFGKYTHQNERALDIDMPIGTKVCTARKGIIIKQIQDNNNHCANISCVDYNNYIDILHDDGTIANYSHLKYKSCKYKVGDVVDEGSVIAESDETGYTSGPHLHFVVYLPGFTNKKTLTTFFKINNGNEISLLKEKQFYFKNY